MDEYIAHKSSDGMIQLLYEHLNNTANLAESFSIDDFRVLCRILGLMHDIGKYQASFQERIRGENLQIEHAVCGAQAIENDYRNTVLGMIMGLCVVGHHTGIPDCGTIADSPEATSYYGRLKRETEDYSAYKTELNIPKANADEFSRFLSSGCRDFPELVERAAFITRYLYSCLTDADAIDTMRAKGESMPEHLTTDFLSCAEKLAREVAKLPRETEVEKAREKLREQALAAISQDAEIYLLNMPTASGKSFTGVQCALERLRRSKGKKRIIYVIPYNSIIDQTVADFENLFGEAASILRHQSTFSFEDKPDVDGNYIRAASFACENWDADFVITTEVQFFESIYSNRKNRLRKLHNMADSIIVFDEAHLIPAEFFQPCLSAIAQIAHFLNSEIIMMTATMPDYKTLFDKYALRNLKVCNLITDRSLFPLFRTAEYHIIGKQSDEEIVKRASRAATSLIIVNTKKAAKKIYRLCSGDKYCLTTYMTEKDRAETIQRIKEHLNALYMNYPNLSDVPAERRITVVATSLIEAGVNMDFEDVYREMSGLDSILQAGGRCNRNGKRPIGHVYIFDRETGRQKMNIKESITRGILSEYPQPDSEDAIAEFYRRLHSCSDEIMKSKAVSKGIDRINMINFRSYSDEFRLIDDDRIESIAVGCTPEAIKLIDELRVTGQTNIRKLRRYCCTVSKEELDTLVDMNAAEQYGSGIWCLTAPGLYDKRTGINFEARDYVI